MPIYKSETDSLLIWGGWFTHAGLQVAVAVIRQDTQMGEAALGLS